MAINIAHRPLKLFCALDASKLFLVNMSGSEQLGGPFRYELELLSESDNIEIKDILGTKMDVVLEHGSETRHFNGYVSRFVQAGYDDSGAMFKYRATLVPWVWFLTRTADCRIFQNMKVLDIIKEVFNESPYAQFEDHLSDNFSDREWENCVQYRETDFNFVSRLMEQEGIYYYFTHELGKHTLVLSDSRGSHDPVPGKDTILFQHDKKNAKEDGIFEWSADYEYPVGRYALRDFNFTDPDPDKLYTLAPSALEIPGIDQHEMYDYPGVYTTSEEGELYSKMRMQELEAQHEVFHGETNVRTVGTGYTFKLAKYRRTDQNEKNYLITSATYKLESDIKSGPGPAGGGGEDIFSCSFTAVNIEQQYRPRRTTPKPVVKGPQTALVVGNSGEKTTVDKYGRVKVQFHWDRYGVRDQNSSCWVRVSQNWAGKGWGGMFIPHLGQEVVVDFLEGDPDRPLITGRVYNESQPVPLELPDNKHKSIIRDNYGNEMVFDATPDKEHIRIYSPHHDSLFELGKSVKYRTDSDRDVYTIGNASSTTLGSTTSTTIGQKHFRTYGFATSVFAGFGVDLWFGGSFALAVGVKGSVSLGGTFDAFFGAKYSFFLGKEVSVGIKSDFVKSVDEGILLDANKDFEFVGGKNDNARIKGGLKTDGLSLTYGSDPVESKYDKPVEVSMRALALTLAGLAAAGGIAALADQGGAEQAKNQANKSIQSEIDTAQTEYDQAVKDRDAAVAADPGAARTAATAARTNATNKRAEADAAPGDAAKAAAAKAAETDATNKETDATKKEKAVTDTERAVRTKKKALDNRKAAQDDQRNAQAAPSTYDIEGADTNWQIAGGIMIGVPAVAAGIYFAWNRDHKAKKKALAAAASLAEVNARITLDDGGVVLRGCGGVRGKTPSTTIYLASASQTGTWKNAISIISHAGVVAIYGKEVLIQAKDKITLDSPEVIIEKNRIKSGDGNFTWGLPGPPPPPPPPPPGG